MNENAIHISHSTGRVKSCPEILVLQADRRQDKDVTQQSIFRIPISFLLVSAV